MFLFLKAAIRGGAAADLFASPVMVQGYTRGSTYVAPHTSTRKKRHTPPQQDLFTAPRSEMVQEHRHLVDVLRSPSHKDDQAEAKKQQHELKELAAGKDEAHPYDEKLKRLAARRGETAESVGTGAPVLTHPPAPKPEPAPAAPRLPRDMAGDHIEFLTPAAGGKLRWVRALVERVWADNWQLRILAAPPRSKLAHAVGKQIARYSPTGPFGLKDWRVVAPDAPMPEEATVRVQAPEAAPAPEAEAPPPGAVAKALERDTAARAKQAARLREQAARTNDAAEEALGRDRKTNTHKRAREAASAIRGANQSAQLAETMRNLADAVEHGEAMHLAGVSTRAHVEMLDLFVRRGMASADRRADRRHDEDRPPTPDDVRAAEMPRLEARPGMARDIARTLTGKGLKVPASIRAIADRAPGPHPDSWQEADTWFPVPEDDARAAITALEGAGARSVGWWLRDNLKDRDRLSRMGIRTDLELRLALTEYLMFRGGHRSEDPITKAERDLVGHKGVDFFPTPPAVVDALLQEADLQEGMRVLEPSAGKGDIADRLRQLGADVETVEIDPKLRTLLEAKGHKIVGSDFEEFEPPPGGYDRIIMNPPFAGGRDADHVRRAYEMLKPGGRLVAVTSAGLGFRQDAKATGFRAWLDELHGTSEPLPEGSFKSAFRPTGVATRLVVVHKPSSAPAVGPQEGDTKQEDGHTYVLRDGRWHRADPEPEQASPRSENAAAAPVSADPAPESLDTPQPPARTFEDALARHGEATGGAPFRPEDVADHWDGRFADDVLDQLYARPDDFALLPDSTWQRMQDYTAAPDREDEIGRLSEALADAGATDDQRARWKRQLRLLAESLADRAPGQPEAREPSPVAAPVEPPPDDLDPSSPNYRYRDTGYIAGSRKELAAESIRQAARKGERVRTTDVDWTELEQNPREAKALITKANVFGDVDWQAMQERGVEPGAAFLISRIYASVATEPADDSPEGRRHYTTAIDSLRDRAEQAKTPADVAKLLAEIADERDGLVLDARESAAMEAVQAIMRAEGEKYSALKTRERELEQAFSVANSARYRITAERDKRVRRGWKVAPEMEAEAKAAQAVADRAAQALEDYRRQNGLTRETIQTKTPDGGVSIRFHEPARSRYDDAARIQRGIQASVIARNQAENTLTRAWRSLGEPFNRVVDYRRYRGGSDAFAGHVAAVKAGKVRDWSWAEQKREVKRATQQSTRFQLRVADRHERIGGRPVPVASTAALKDAFGLRDVQSGKWVLEDPNSAKFHTERCAEAFADLADLLGVPDQQVAMKGRLAMAFGARGQGAKGWAEGAAAAHYESIHRVINITKMAGGGSLAHEWFHFMDNVLSEAASGKPAGADSYATEHAADLPPELGAAARDLVATMMGGPHRRIERMPYAESEVAWARGNVEAGAYYGGSVRKAIRDAATMQEAVDAVERLHQQGSFGALGRKKTTSNANTWRRIALIYHAERERAAKGLAADAPREAAYAHGPGMSLFLKDAVDLDRGVSGKYWSQPKEMAARAFSAWCQDKLEQQGRRNTYLVAMADNAAYRAMGMPDRPFPESDERDRIVAAFDKFLGVLRDRGDLAKALALMAA